MSIDITKICTEALDGYAESMAERYRLIDCTPDEMADNTPEQVAMIEMTRRQNYSVFDCEQFVETLKKIKSAAAELGMEKQA